MKTKRVSLLRRQGPEVLAADFKEVKSAHDIGLDKVIGAIDGPIDMRLGGKMHDLARFRSKYFFS